MSRGHIRSYSELCKLQTFEERFEYLMLGGAVSELTFDSYRYVNQAFYTSTVWRRIRDAVIVRDLGCDLGVPGYDLLDGIYIHHMNPITLDDLEDWDNPYLVDPEFLITTSFNTHQAIHYGSSDFLRSLQTERHPWDTCPWKDNKSIYEGEMRYERRDYP